MQIRAAIALLVLFANLHVFARDGWRFGGPVIDIRNDGSGKPARTNYLSIAGYRFSDAFGFTVYPDDTSDEIEETFGWSGTALHFITRFPEEPGKGQPRDRSLGYVEPTLFSRYASHAALPVLIALASTNAIYEMAYSNRYSTILGTLRHYPEESNTFRVLQLGGTDLLIQAYAPGTSVQNGDLVPLYAPYRNGFLRWSYTSTRTLENKVVFEYRRFLPKHPRQEPKDKMDVLCYRQVTGSLLFEKSTAVPLDLLPAIAEERLPIWDFRFRSRFEVGDNGGKGETLIQHFLTNKIWELNDSDSLMRATNIQLSDSTKKRSLAYIRAVFGSLLVVCFVAPIAGLYWRNSKTKSKSER